MGAMRKLGAADLVRAVAVVATAGAALVAVNIVFARGGAREGMADPSISDTQYYSLVSVLRGVVAADPKLESPFGIHEVNSLGITDPAYAAVLMDDTMLHKDKLSALMTLVDSNPPARLPPYTVRPKKMYETVRFAATKPAAPKSETKVDSGSG